MAPFVRRLLSLFGRRCDEFSSITFLRYSASAACSRNIDHPIERHLPPLSRQHGSMAEAVMSSKPLVVYHTSLALAGEGSSLATSSDDYEFTSFTQPFWKPSHQHTSHGHSSPSEPAGPPLTVSVSGRSLPPYLDDGYHAYRDMLRREGNIPPHLEPSYEEYSRALMMEMDFSATSKEIARRLVGSAMKRGAFNQVKGSQTLLQQWTEEMTAALTRDKGRVLEALKGNSTLSSLDYQSSYYTILHSLRPRRLAEITADSEFIPCDHPHLLYF